MSTQEVYHKMLLAIRTASLRALPFLTRTPVVQAAVARFPMSHRFKSATPFAVDGPDGDHDFQEIVCVVVVVCVCVCVIAFRIGRRYTRYAYSCPSHISPHLLS